MEKSDAELRGIGGWLILLAIGIITMPGGLLKNCGMPRAPSKSPILQGYVTSDSRWHALEIIQTAGNGIAVLPALFLIPLFFCKHRFFPTAFATLAAWLTATRLVEAYLVIAIPTTSPAYRAEVLSSAFASPIILVIWTTYLFRSKRARLTFTRQFFLTPCFPFFSAM